MAKYVRNPKKAAAGGDPNGTPYSRNRFDPRIRTAEPVRYNPKGPAPIVNPDDVGYRRGKQKTPSVRVNAPSGGGKMVTPSVALPWYAGNPGASARKKKFEYLNPRVQGKNAGRTIATRLKNVTFEDGSSDVRREPVGPSKTTSFDSENMPQSSYQPKPAKVPKEKVATKSPPPKAFSKKPTTTSFDSENMPKSSYKPDNAALQQLLASLKGKKYKGGGGGSGNFQK